MRVAVPPQLGQASNGTRDLSGMSPLAGDGGEQVSRSSQRAAADCAFSLYIRKRDGMCRACGYEVPSELQCAHIWSRRYYATRFDERNAVALCRGCHIMFTHSPAQWDEWCEENIPDYRLLRSIAVSGHTADGTLSNKLDYLAIKRAFTQRLEELAA